MKYIQTMRHKISSYNFIFIHVGESIFILVDLTHCSLKGIAMFHTFVNVLFESLLYFIQAVLFPFIQVNTSVLISISFPVSGQSDKAIMILPVIPQFLLLTKL